MFERQEGEVGYMKRQYLVSVLVLLGLVVGVQFLLASGKWLLAAKIFVPAIPVVLLLLGIYLITESRRTAKIKAKKRQFSKRLQLTAEELMQAEIASANAASGKTARLLH